MNHGSDDTHPSRIDRDLDGLAGGPLGMGIGFLAGGDSSKCDSKAIILE